MPNIKINSAAGIGILAATIAASGLAFLAGSTLNLAIDDMQVKLGASVTDIQWIVNSYALALATLILVAGTLADKYGRKLVYSLGVIIFILGSLASGLVADTSALILCRAIQGIGAALMTPGSLAIINAQFAENERGRAIGLWSGLSGGLAAAGPLIGGLLVENFGWQSIFLFNVPIGVFALALIAIYVPESKNPKAGKMDIIGTTLIAIAMFAATYAITNGRELGWTSAAIVFAALLTVVTIGAFVWYERRIENPLIPSSLFKNRNVLGANLVTVLLYFAMGGLFFFVSLNLLQLQGMPESIAGIAQLPPILIMTLFAGLAGKWADSVGDRKPMLYGLFLIAVAMLLLTIPASNANYFLEFFPALVIFGVGMTMTVPALTRSALSVDVDLSGVASAVNNAAARISGAMTVAILGTIIVIVFTANLAGMLEQSDIPMQIQQEILTDADSLLRIEVANQNYQSQVDVIKADAFVPGFRLAVMICAALVVISWGITFYYVDDSKA